MSQPEIALLVSTYQRPEHLRRALLSVAIQDGVTDKMELVVTDDGSTDETAEVVESFRKRAPFRVGFTTHAHENFLLTRCRNEGVRASTAPYILFLDGDCILPKDFVRQHLAHRQPKTVMTGDVCRLAKDASEHVSFEAIRREAYLAWAPADERKRLRSLVWKHRYYGWIGHKTKPRLMGGTTALWRSDYEAVNGYDENFVGWGCEDDDLRCRLTASGVRIASILRYTHAYHLWHPAAPSTPTAWKDGANVKYLKREERQTRCANGLQKLAA